MFSCKSLIILAAMAVATSAGASVTIDFDTMHSSSPTMTFGVVTFTADGGGVLSAGFGATPNGTPGMTARRDGRFVPVRATIAGGTTAMSIDLGDFASDDDALFLRLYDARDVLLAQQTGFIPASFAGMVRLSATAPDIAYAVYGSVGAGGESSVYSDNFTFEPRPVEPPAAVAVVPEPATWALVIGGFGLVGGGLRRRRAVGVA